MCMLEREWKCMCINENKDTNVICVCGKGQSERGREWVGSIGLAMGLCVGEN